MRRIERYRGVGKERERGGGGGGIWKNDLPSFLPFYFFLPALLSTCLFLLISLSFPLSFYIFCFFFHLISASFFVSITQRLSPSLSFSPNPFRSLLPFSLLFFPFSLSLSLSLPFFPVSLSYPLSLLFTLTITRGRECNIFCEKGVTEGVEKTELRAK